MTDSSRRDVWKNEFIGEFQKPNPAYARAFLLWVRYHYETELFDRRLTNSRMPDGSAGPLLGDQLTRSNKHARELRKRVLTELGMTPTELCKQAEIAAGHLSFAELEELLATKKES